MGDFYFLRQSGPEILPPERKNPSPEKEIPGPGIFFPSPEIFSRRFRSPFSRYLELFHRQIPDVNMSAQAPPGLRAPAIPARKQPAPATKRKPAPLICRHLGFRTFRETAFFAPAPASRRVQVNLSGLQMTKCQNPRKIAKCYRPPTVRNATTHMETAHIFPKGQEKRANVWHIRRKAVILHRFSASSLMLTSCDGGLSIRKYLIYSSTKKLLQ